MSDERTYKESEDPGERTETRTETRLQPGELVVDSEGSDDEAVVLHTPEMTAGEWEVTDGETVADHNPDYPEDENVVIAAFVKGDGVTGMEEWDSWEDADPYSLFDGAVEKGVKFYAFPESRLEPLGENALNETNGEKTALEEIHSSLLEQGWESAEIDDERQVVVVEKFGEYVVHPDGDVEGEGTLREKLELAVEGTV